MFFLLPHNLEIVPFNIIKLLKKREFLMVRRKYKNSYKDIESKVLFTFLFPREKVSKISCMK